MPFGSLTDESINPLKKKPNPLDGGPMSGLSNLTQGTPLSGMMSSGIGTGTGPGGGGFGSPVFNSSTPISPTPISAPPANPGSIPGNSPLQSSTGNVTPYAYPKNTSSNNLQNVMAQLFNYNVGTQGNLMNQVEGDLNFGNIPNTPLYKANLTGANEATSSAYDQAVTNARANANQRGFGYTSPVEQGSEAGIRASEAGQMAKNPASALLQTIQPQLQSAQILSGDMAQFNPNQVIPSWEDLLAKKGAASSGMLSSLMAAIGQLGSAGISKIGASGADSSGGG